MKLYLPKRMYEDIEHLVMDTGLETGVSLFGDKTVDGFRVLGIAGPGPKATHEECHYSGDEDHKNEVYDSLLKENPNVEYIGELHAHPFGMSWLSGGDVQTVKDLLKEFPYFVAGVMLRDPFEIYAWYFPGKQKVEVICEPIRKSCRSHWFRIWRLCCRRYAGQSRSRGTDSCGPR